MDGISALMKVTLHSSLAHFYHVRTQDAHDQKMTLT